MSKILFIVIAAAISLSSGCVSLTYQEKRNIAMLKANGVTVDRPIGGFESPNSCLAAGLLNVLPGIGNFYLGVGNGSDSIQCVYGFANFWLWPISIVWAAPQAIIDAETLNEREMLYYYHYNKYGQKALKEKDLSLE